MSLLDDVMLVGLNPREVADVKKMDRSKKAPLLMNDLNDEMEMNFTIFFESNKSFKVVLSVPGKRKVDSPWSITRPFLYLITQSFLFLYKQ